MTVLIKGERVKTARRAALLLHHLLRGEENEAVTLLDGTEDDFRAAFADARSAGKKFCLRHFIISPGKPISRVDAIMIFGLLRNEFSFQQKSALSVEHVKPRTAASAYDSHWHFLVPELDPATGRVMSSQFNFLRHAKVAVIAAHRLGFGFIRFPKERALLAALEFDGHLDVAAAYQNFIENDPGQAHREAFSRDVQQMAKRSGVDVPASRAVVRAAWETTHSRKDFAAALAGHRLRLRPGDKAETFVVETFDGVFIGAGHRLARARRADFLIRMQGGQDDREQHRAPDQREGILYASTFTDREHHQTSGSIGSEHRKQQSENGPRLRIVGVDSHCGTRSADQQRSPAPARRRHCSLRSRGSSRRFWETLNRDPARLRKMLGHAQALARPPVDRVVIGLNRYENSLEERLKALQSRPPPSAALAAAHHSVKNLRVRIDKYDAAIGAARRYVQEVVASEPGGFRARVDGARHRWERRLTAAEARHTTLTEKRTSLCVRLRRTEESVADLEKCDARAHSRNLRSAAHVENADRLRREIARVSGCRARLNIFPALAWGGVAMALAVAAAVAAVDQIVDSGSELPAVWSGGTDLWGVALLPPPA